MLLLAKIVLQLSLFTAFVFLYGLPALKRLDRRRTIVLESRKKTNGVVAPSITIVEQLDLLDLLYFNIQKTEKCPVTGIGWKLAAKESRIASRKDRLKVQCKNFHLIHNCLNNITGKTQRKPGGFRMNSYLRGRKEGGRGPKLPKTVKSDFWFLKCTKKGGEVTNLVQKFLTPSFYSL